MPSSSYLLEHYLSPTSLCRFTSRCGLELASLSDQIDVTTSTFFDFEHSMCEP
jgi:hypothetical protein